jgi:sulfur-oxidizing protein SoxY
VGQAGHPPAARDARRAGRGGAALIYQTAWRDAQGQQVTKEVSMIKALRGTLVNEVMYDCLQFHGGMGYIRETAIERMARDARIQVQMRSAAARPRCTCWMLEVAKRMVPQLSQTPGRYIRKLMLVVDKNPSPVGATFSFTPQSGRADIETRVRVEEYSHVRAIAELNDGSLVMQVRFIKAAGGCSAPAGADLAAAMANLGKIDLRIDESTPPDQPTRVQLTVNHPNISGLAIDQLTRLAPAPHYVRSIEVRWAGQPLMSADVDFSISENPSLRFYFVRQGAGELRADVVDNKDLKFHTTLAVKASPASSG